MKTMIVDDSLIICSQLSQFIKEDLGYDVVATCNDGLEAIETFIKLKPEFITLDITMPNMNGLDTLDQILTIAPKTKVVMISALQNNKLILDALEKGAKGYISKPLEMSSESFKEQFKQDIIEALDNY
tara:strand:+ start:195 stop:578 length:384 start_codon:yes stop_codon:yes gene_type:complete